MDRLTESFLYAVGKFFADRGMSKDKKGYARSKPAQDIILNEFRELGEAISRNTQFRCTQPPSYKKAMCAFEVSRLVGPQAVGMGMPPSVDRELPEMHGPYIRVYLHLQKDGSQKLSIQTRAEKKELQNFDEARNEVLNALKEMVTPAEFLQVQQTLTQANPKPRTSAFPSP